MDRKAEVAAKLAKVTGFLQQQKLDGVILTRRENFSWLTAGGMNHIPVNEEEGVASLLVTPEKIVVLTTNIEAPRIAAEEVANLDMEIRTFPWHHDKEAEIAAIAAELKWGSDNGIAGTRNVRSSFAPLRYELMPSECERYKALGKDAACALEAVARRVRPGMSEISISALLAAEVIDRGMEPTVNLVAVDERIRRFRHPLPTQQVLNNYCMLVLCARRSGLVVAATRLVHFGSLPSDLAVKHQAVCHIEAVMYAATRPGTPVASVLAAGVAAYASNGYSDEWQLHHQGGPAGYNNREYLATPASTEVVYNHQAFAWNPSITGTKNEDTILVDGANFSIVTVGDGNWPYLQITHGNNQVARPDILVL